MSYRINEIFCAPQGEGGRQGQWSAFVRFTGCNLRCRIEPGRRSPGGFDCDTEFMSGTHLSADAIDFEARQAWCDRAPLDAERWIVLTGGEPMLQVDAPLIDYLHACGWKLQIETNGSRPVPHSIDYITVSPKVAEHAIRQIVADEVKYVRGYGQDIPRTRVAAKRQFISPAFDGLSLDERTLEWCRRLVYDHPDWSLSIQMHKVWGER